MGNQMTTPRRVGPYEQQWIDEKRRSRMDRVDNFPPEVRALVHEYGLNVVGAFLQCGVTSPRQIRHLVNTVLDDFSPTRGSYSSQGQKTPYEVRAGDNQ
jgi:hypothetical protein